jgi:amidase
MDPDLIDDGGIAGLRAALDGGATTSAELVAQHLARIRELDDVHRAVLTLNPEAPEIAAGLDAELAAGRCRGPLHGVPVLVKDNLDTGDGMPTTAGSLALAGTHASSDSTVVARLRAAGAVLLGKTNLSEWANFRSTRSSSGWSSLGGQTRNAHDPDRTPGGSSSGSGVAVALRYCAGAIGTETDGSIVSPASMNGVVGIKPSLGLVSRAGIIPIAASQDTAGPMTRSVRDALLLLAAIAGADPRDPTTAAGVAVADALSGLARDLDGAGLRGVRLGVARSYAGYHDGVDALLEDALSALRGAGAEIVDEVPLTPGDTLREPEQVVMEYEFKHGLEAYLRTRDDTLAVRDLAGVVRFNEDNAQTVMPHFGQERHLAALSRGALTDPDYLTARERSLALAARDGIDAALSLHRLDALVAPTTSPAWLIDWICGDNRKGSAAAPAAVAGYPHVSVPMGCVRHLPVGLSIFAGAMQDATVIRIAHAFERLMR